MKALCYHGHGDVRVDNVPDPKIEQPTDVIIKVTSTAICGSDLQLMEGHVPTMHSGDVLGHEAMGIVVEVGDAVEKLKEGDRVVVPFTVSCGACFFCKKGLFSLCDNSNPNARLAERAMGHAPGGLLGHTHLLGGYAGGQAEYLRVPFADVGPIKIESDLPDEKVLFLSDIFPTGWMAAERADIEPGDTVAIWGCGAVAQLTIKSAWMLKAGRVIAIDDVPERLQMARDKGGAETIHFGHEDVYGRLQQMTGGRGPDRCIDAVGCEAHGTNGFDAVLVRAKAAVKLATDRAHALRQAVYCCRKGGSISVPGAYDGCNEKFPLGAFTSKGLTMKAGQTHVPRYMRPLLERIESGEIDPSFVITHELALEDAPEAYRMFRDKRQGCIKVVLHP
ncbi:MAG: fdm 4 [Myxococcaceae bacterium]|nr:fdm 4 [Myxococcaceae bacterium]